MAQTEAQRLAAVRQARRRAKLLAAEAERDELLGEVRVRDALIERLEAAMSELQAALEAERATSSAGRCQSCGAQLACPRCYCEGGWDSP